MENHAHEVYVKTEKQKWLDALIDTMLVILGPIVAGVLVGAALIWVLRTLT